MATLVLSRFSPIPRELNFFLERIQTTRFYTILTAHRYSTRFSRLHRSRHEREKRKKGVEKYGGFSNVWGKDGSRAVITIRTADSARFFNGCLAFRTRQRNIVSVTHPPSRTVISRRVKKVDGTPLFTPPSLLYCRVSRGIRRHSSPSLSLFSSRKNVHKEVVGGRSAFLIRNSPFDNNFLNEKKRKEGELLDDLNFEQRKWNYNLPSFLPSFLLFPFFAYRWRDLFDIILPLEKVPNEFDFFPTNHRVGREKGGEELSHRAVRGGYSIGVLISARSLLSRR